MTEMERLIWAAAFAAEWAKERKLRQETPATDPVWMDPDSISGYQCGELADAALTKYREAMAEDALHHGLLPTKEGWNSK